MKQSKLLKKLEKVEKEVENLLLTLQRNIDEAQDKIWNVIGDAYQILEEGEK